MSFVVRAERTIAAPPQRAFDRLADFAGWASWMPRSFVPSVKGRGASSPSPLRVGDRFRVKVGGAPFPSVLTVIALERPREIAWRGGLGRLLWAEHRFVFEPEGDRRTRVLSIETWHGPLARALRRLVEPASLRIGGEQLEALARAASLDIV